MFDETTRHGENIASQIQSEDAYGRFNVLNLADVWNIVDNLHTHFLDHKGEDAPILRVLEGWMRQLEDMKMEKA